MTSVSAMDCNGLFISVDQSRLPCPSNSFQFLFAQWPFLERSAYYVIPQNPLRIHLYCSSPLNKNVQAPWFVCCFSLAGIQTLQDRNHSPIISYIITLSHSQVLFSDEESIVWGYKQTGVWPSFSSSLRQGHGCLPPCLWGLNPQQKWELHYVSAPPLPAMPKPSTQTVQTFGECPWKHSN